MLGNTVLMDIWPEPRWIWMKNQDSQRYDWLYKPFIIIHEIHMYFLSKAQSEARMYKALASSE